MKKIYFIAFALIISCIAASGQSTETKTPPSATIQNIPAANVGNITVNINLTGFSPDIISFQWTIKFDSTILQYQNTTNWFSGITGVLVQQPTTGKITMVYGEAFGTAINGLLCTLNFNYLGTPSCTNITWSDLPTQREIADGSYNIYTVNYVNGQVCQNTVGVEENTQQNNINIFPNPSSGNLNISLPAFQYQSELEIFNNIGMKVYKQSVAQGTNSLNLNLDLPNGAYIIKLSNQETANSKLVIIAR